MEFQSGATNSIAKCHPISYRQMSALVYDEWQDWNQKTGVAPDVEVEKSFKDRLHNVHPQLDAAIRIILEELK